jgi:hypothetical protein
MFRSPPCVLSPEPSRAELAAAITAADEISVDCTGYTFALLSSRRVADQPGAKAAYHASC